MTSQFKFKFKIRNKLIFKWLLVCSLTLIPEVVQGTPIYYDDGVQQSVYQSLPTKNLWALGLKDLYGDNAFNGLICTNWPFGSVDVRMELGKISAGLPNFPEYVSHFVTSKFNREKLSAGETVLVDGETCTFDAGLAGGTYHYQVSFYLYCPMMTYKILAPCFWWQTYCQIGFYSSKTSCFSNLRETISYVDLVNAGQTLFTEDYNAAVYEVEDYTRMFLSARKFQCVYEESSIGISSGRYYKISGKDESGVRGSEEINMTPWSEYCDGSYRFGDVWLESNTTITSANFDYGDGILFGPSGIMLEEPCRNVRYESLHIFRDYV